MQLDSLSRCDGKEISSYPAWLTQFFCLCQQSGSIPESYGQNGSFTKLSQLGRPYGGFTAVDLSGNRLTGPLPPAFTSSYALFQSTPLHRCGQQILGV